MDYRSKINYNPSFFNPVDKTDAKRIVLGHGVTETPHKWDIETAWNMRMFQSRGFLNENSVVLDWGCGIGRLSKEIINTFNCKVVGVDISQPMLDYAKEEVNSNNFTTILAEDFKKYNTTKFTNAIAVWALQHSIYVDDELSAIKTHLLPEGLFFVFEENKPAIPIVNTGDGPWFLLRESYRPLIESQFALIEHGIFPPSLNIPENNGAWWGFLRNKKTA